MSNKRRYFFLLAAHILIGAIVYTSWYHPRELEHQARPAAPGSQRTLSVPQKVTEVQAKILIGAKRYLDVLLPNVVLDPEKREELESQLAGAIQSATEQMLDLELEMARRPGLMSPSDRAVRRSKGILALSLGFRAQARELFLLVGAQPDRSAAEIRTDSLLIAAVDSGAPDGATVPREYSAEDQRFLSEQLGWIASVFEEATVQEPSRKASLERAVSQSAGKTFRRIFIALAIGCLLLAISFVSFLVLAVRFATGSTRLQYQPGTMPPEFGLEVFTLYLAAMLAAPRALDWLSAAGVRFDILLLNCVAIVSLLALTFWPRAFGIPLREISSFLGLAFGGTKRIVMDIAGAPFVYLAAWVILAVIFIAYSALISALGIDVTQGAHPVVPLLLDSDDTRTRLLVTLLAVGVAPLVEEIMFRGAYYGWLRSRFGRLASMGICSFLFAAIHPQGPIGIVPLFSIGMVLAFVREWRGTLLMSMIVHGCVNAGTLVLILVFLT